MPTHPARALLLMTAALIAAAADSDGFTYFDAATATKLPGGATASGTRIEWVAGERRAAGLRVAFAPGATPGALQIDATSAAAAFADPDQPAEPQALLLSLRASAGSTVVVRLTDAANAVFTCSRSLDGEGWKDLRLELAPEMPGWKATADGARFKPRIKAIAVGLAPAGGATAGVLDLVRVAAVASAMELAFTTRAPGNLFVTGEPPVGRITAGGEAVRIWIEDALGRSVREIPKVALSGGGADVALPDGFGFYYVKGKVLGYRPGSLGGYAVIPDNRVAGREPNSPYGVCCHWGDYWYQPIAAVVAKRAGIAWIRDGHHQDNPAAGAAHDNAKAVGLCMLDGSGWCPEREQDVLRKDGTYDFSDFLNRRAAHARAVAADNDFYDMCNEPVFAWSKVFGSPRWLEVFSKHFAPQYLAAMQQADPGARIFWEGYPDQMEAFIAAGGAKSVAGVSPHPYAHKAEPEDHMLLNGGYARQVELTAKAGVKWPVWIGEIGFSTFQGDSQYFKSVSELEQAALLVRALSMHYAAGVEKIFYYDLVEWTAATWHQDASKDATNCEFHFGLLRKDHTAKPAMAAYANLIAQTKGCRWLGGRQRGEARIYAFAPPGGKPAYVAWTRSGTAPLALPAGAVVTDIFGAATTWGGGNLALSTVPVYLSGCQLEVEAIATYEQLPRFHDATKVQVGPGYGGTRTVRARPSQASPAEAKPDAPAAAIAPAPVHLVPKAAAASTWDKALYERLGARLAQGKTPVFVYELMKQPVRILAADGRMLDGLMGIDGRFSIDWKRLSAADRLRLAQAMLDDGKDSFEPSGNALVAYHAFAADRPELAKACLDKCGVLAAQVKDAFEAVAPTPTPGAAPAP